MFYNKNITFFKILKFQTLIYNKMKIYLNNYLYIHLKNINKFI